VKPVEFVNGGEMGSSNNAEGRGLMSSSNGHADYPIELPIRYELVNGAGETGNGTTVRMGRRGVVFTSDKPLPVNEKLRLTLKWPAPLPDGTGLNLWIVGIVVRGNSRLAEVEISRYEFRTRGKGHTNASQQADGKKAYGAGA
jgi:hypothetical protein